MRMIIMCSFYTYTTYILAIVILSSSAAKQVRVAFRGERKGPTSVQKELLSVHCTQCLKLYFQIKCKS